MDAPYIGLPVLIVNDWAEVTEELLYVTLHRFEKQQRLSRFSWERMFLPYWKAMLTMNDHTGR